MAVCDMTAKQVEKEYGPIVIIDELETAIKNPDVFSPKLFEDLKKSNLQSQL